MRAKKADCGRYESDNKRRRRVLAKKFVGSRHAKTRRQLRTDGVSVKEDRARERGSFAGKVKWRDFAKRAARHSS